jgi:ribonucleotide reductase beta subunit family protein with ferritin-like domain
LPITTLPEVETFIATWTFSETIHSRSYTHIIRNIFSDPGMCLMRCWTSKRSSCVPTTSHATMTIW